MKCVIIDDEPLAIRVLTKHVTKTPGLQLIKSFENAFEALYYIQTHVVDLVFLDIQMPGVNGLQFIRILKFPPKIIITSAHKDYALEALELGVIDYLVKPVPLDRFLSAVSKALEHPGFHHAKLNITDHPDNTHFFLREGSHYVKISENKILYLEGDRNYCTIYLTNKKVKLSGNLSHYFSRLSKYKFMRIHKSYIVCLEHIDRYNSESVWIGEAMIPIGKTYKHPLMQYFEQKRL